MKNVNNSILVESIANDINDDLLTDDEDEDEKVNEWKEPKRHSTREKRKQNRLGISNFCFALNAEGFVNQTPEIYDDAMKSDDHHKRNGWRNSFIE